jgi:dsRNA-specific ribonuclease
MKSKNKDETMRAEQAEAWVGDAVLDLWARQWILEHCGEVRGDVLMRMTSNQFLSGVGNPTAVEAKIGRLFREGGAETAHAWIEAELLPRFLQQARRLEGMPKAPTKK